MGDGFLRRCRRLLALVLLLVAVSSHDALAGKRLAIIVGNNDYAEVPKLSTAVNDAREAREVLERRGFSVEVVENGTKRQISRALAKIESAIEPGDSVLFHFAGHGFEIDGQNWLLPIDVPAAKQGESGVVKDESFNAADIIERFRAKGAGTVVAILDACRDNPFAQGGTRALGGGRGLARMDASGGVFILFSAGAKQQALDRLSPADPVQTSIFARTFLPLLADGRMTLIDLAKETQVRVRTLARSVGHEQLPAYYDGVVGRIGITGEVSTESAPPTMQAPSAAPPVSPEDLFWRSVEAKNDRTSYRAYLDEVGRGAFPGTYRRLAELRLAALTTPAPAPAATPAPPRTQPTPPPRQEAGGPEIEACDRAGSAPDDKEKPPNVPGIAFGELAAPSAVAACSRAVAITGAPRRLHFQLGRAYFKLRNMRDAAANYQKGAELGHGLAMHSLGVMHLKGEGVGRDYGMARSLFEGAGAEGLGASLREIGIMYSRGLGTSADYLKARFYYEKATELGESLAFNDLGVLYFEGRGVPRDRNKACEFFRRGAAAADPIAVNSTNRNCRGR